MKKTDRNLLLTVLYLLCLYLACQFVPYFKITTIPMYQVLIKTGLTSVVLFLCLIETKKNQTSHLKNMKAIDIALLIPLLLPCFSNLIYANVYQVPKVTNLNIGLLFASTFMSLVSVIVEEMIFRYFLIFFFFSLFEKKKYKTDLTIFFSALMFSLMHVINFTSGNYLGTGLQIAYTFFLGIIIGYFACKLENIYLPIVGHFLFNLFNQILFTNLYSMTEYSFTYICLSVAFGVFEAAYFILYVYLRTRREKDAS